MSGSPEAALETRYPAEIIRQVPLRSVLINERQRDHVLHYSMNFTCVFVS